MAGEAGSINSAYNEHNCRACSSLTTLHIWTGKARQDAASRDEDVAALVQAIPQLRKLYLSHYAMKATDAGLSMQGHTASAWTYFSAKRFGLCGNEGHHRTWQDS
jgi:hypothetical protein